MKKGKFNKYVSTHKRKQSKSSNMAQRKKEVLRKIKSNQSNLSNKPPRQKFPKLKPDRKPANLNFKKSTSPWKLKGVLFFASMLLVILLIPTLIVVPSATGSELDSTSKDTENTQKESAKASESNSSLSVAVMRSEAKEVEDVPLESYVEGVVAAEMPVSDFEMEALKAQALAARTYIVDHLLHKSDSEESDGDVSDTEQHQVYKNETELKKMWGNDYDDNIEKLREAVMATEGEILTYDDTPILPAFFSTSNGFTENSEDYWENEVPYLRSVESPWDEDSSKFLDQKTMSIQEVEQLLGIDLPKNTAVPIETTRTEGKRVAELTLGEHSLSGRDVREKLELRSSDFTIKQKGNHFIFTTKGFGHGIGMSQFGADGMAKDGKDYQDIVKYYYQDVEISTVTETAPTLVSK
ncbi:stage II sporulation protein D [Virgibacillus sp. MSJ-26]|uniref:stage II sporulation protein D n=1 Tax=Virgibacillus sp. MSJ-26 TaxID=2841522 RepID=UPI0035304730